MSIVPQPNALSRQEASEPSLGRLLSDREFQDRLDLLFRRSPAKQRAARRLRDRMDSRGRVTLAGGIRGWTEVLQCGLSRPRDMLEEMSSDEAIGLDIAREPGGWVAHIVVLIAFAPPDRSPITEPPSPAPSSPPEPEITAPHQEAVNDSADRSGIKPPQTPHVVHDSESMQQQQHARAHEATRFREEAPNRGYLTEQLLAAFPQADRGLLAAWETHLGVNLVAAAHKALAGRPRATAAEWAEDLRLAEDDRGADFPPGFVLSIWADGGRVTPRRRTLASRVQQRAGANHPAARELVDPEAAARWMAEQGISVSLGSQRLGPEPEPPPRPARAPDPPPSAAPPSPAAPPPIVPRPQLLRPLPGERRLGPIAEAARERQREKFRSGR